MEIELDDQKPKKTIIFGVHQENQDAVLSSNAPIECYLKDWSAEDLAQAATWSHLKVKGRRYKILSSVRNSPFTIQLDQ